MPSALQNYASYPVFCLWKSQKDDVTLRNDVSLAAYWFNSIYSVSATRWIRMGSRIPPMPFLCIYWPVCEFTCSHFLTLLTLFPQLHVVADSKSLLYALTNFGFFCDKLDYFWFNWGVSSSYIIGVIEQQFHHPLTHCCHVVESWSSLGWKGTLKVILSTTPATDRNNFN